MALRRCTCGSNKLAYMVTDNKGNILKYVCEDCDPGKVFHQPAQNDNEKADNGDCSA